MPDCIHRTCNEGSPYWLILDKLTPKIGFDETAEQFSLHVIECPPGGGPPPHLHRDEDEAFIVLEGEFTFLQNDKLVRCPAGFSGIGLRDIVHTFKNTHTGWSKMLCFAIGGPFERFMMELAEPVTDPDNCPPVTPELIQRVMSVAPRFGIEMKMHWPTPSTHLDMPGPKERYWVCGDRVDFICTGAETGNRFALVEITSWPGNGPPPHLHKSEGECFYIIEGEFEMLLSDRVQTLSAGDAAYVPPGAMHYYKNAGARVGRFISLHHPGGIEEFFREAGCPVAKFNQPPADAVDLTKVIAAAKRHGMELKIPVD